MPELKQELRVLDAFIEHFTPYIYDDELFGQVDNRLPKLTVGGLLFRLHLLESLHDHLSPDEQAQLHAARQNFESLRYEWLGHYKDKLLQEMRSRIHSIEWYLEDCGTNPAGCDGGWPNEAEKRTILEHLRLEAIALDALPRELKSDLSQLDTHLRRHYRTSQFIWDESLQAAYPQEQFWWLYGRPKPHDS